MHSLTEYRDQRYLDGVPAWGARARPTSHPDVTWVGRKPTTAHQNLPYRATEHPYTRPPSLPHQRRQERDRHRGGRCDYAHPNRIRSTHCRNSNGFAASSNRDYRAFHRGWPCGRSQGVPRCRRRTVPGVPSPSMAAVVVRLDRDPRPVKVDPPSRILLSCGHNLMSAKTRVVALCAGGGEPIILADSSITAHRSSGTSRPEWQPIGYTDGA